MFPLGGGGDCEQCMQPMFPPTPKAKEHKNKLQVIAFIQLFLVLALMFTVSIQFVQQLLTVCMLFCSTMNFNPCCLMFYIFYSMIDLFQVMDPVGMVFQTSILQGQIPNFTPASILLLLYVFFIPVAIYYVF